MTTPKPIKDRLKARDRAILFFSGALTTLGFAPFHLWWLPPITLAVLFIHWRAHRSFRMRAGFTFGLGLFVAGIHWIYISLHDHGGMPAPLALLALLGFSGFVAMLPAVAGGLSRLIPESDRHDGLTFPAVWTLMEWTRTWFCTGFPWLAMGYSQVPGSPLTGWIPVLGVYGASFAVSMIASALAIFWLNRRPLYPVLLIAGLLTSGFALKQVPWVRPLPETTATTLIQGNVLQDEKFDPAHLKEGLERYLALTEASRDPLVIMPESSIPLLLSDTPKAYLDRMAAVGIRNGGDILVGVFSDTEPDQIHNSMLSLGLSPSQHYFKHHLVPFGEFIPLESVISPVMDAVLNMPIGSQQAGARKQDLFHVAKTHLALNICYEDAFGEEIIDALPEARFLVNVSNDAWFGAEIGPEQHLQMAATRSVETGREMARVTNTGVTAFIDIWGHIKDRAPSHQIASLHGTLQAYSGTTPFVYGANTPIVILCLLALATRAFGRRQNSR